MANSIYEFFAVSPGDKKRRALELDAYKQQLGMQNQADRERVQMLAEEQRIKDSRAETDMIDHLFQVVPGESNEEKAANAMRAFREIKTSAALADSSGDMNRFIKNKAIRPYAAELGTTSAEREVATNKSELELIPDRAITEKGANFASRVNSRIRAAEQGARDVTAPLRAVAEDQAATEQARLNALNAGARIPRAATTAVAQQEEDFATAMANRDRAMTMQRLMPDQERALKSDYGRQFVENTDKTVWRPDPIDAFELERKKNAALGAQYDAIAADPSVGRMTEEQRAEQELIRQRLGRPTTATPGQQNTPLRTRPLGFNLND